MSSPKCLVLGYGTIGWAISLILSDFGFEVTSADPKKVDATTQVDVLKNPEEILGYDYVINTVPVYDPTVLTPLLIKCLQGGVHYLDTNEDVGTRKLIQSFGSAQKEILFAPGCGLAPGFINIIGGHLNRRIPNGMIDLRVGALTRLVEGPYKYTPTWSTEGLVNQYLNDFQVVESGKEVTYSTVWGTGDKSTAAYNKFVRTFTLDGISYECFPTSGGIGTMVEMENVPSITYRSIRLAGHLSATWNLINENRNDRKSAARILSKYWDGCTPDYVLIVASVSAPFDQGKYTMILRSDCEGGWSAIQKTTAASLVGIIELHQQSKIPNGFLHQHNVDYADFLGTKAYQMMEFK